MHRQKIFSPSLVVPLRVRLQFCADFSFFCNINQLVDSPQPGSNTGSMGAQSQATSTSSQASNVNSPQEGTP